MSQSTLNPTRVLITIGFGIVLAILVVPVAGPWTLPALLAIAGLVLFDIWRQMTANQRDLSWQDRFKAQPAWIRFAVVLGVSALIVAILLAYGASRP